MSTTGFPELLSSLPNPAGEALMAYYRLYHIRGAHFSGSEEIEAANDALAIDAAERRTDAGHAELWLGGHKIKRIVTKTAAAAG